MLTEVTRERVVMFILENLESEVGGVRDIDATIQAEETIGVKGPARLSRSGELSRSNWDHR